MVQVIDVLGWKAEHIYREVPDSVIAGVRLVLNDTRREACIFYDDLDTFEDVDYKEAKRYCTG